jgi:hypothetical protein
MKKRFDLYIRVCFAVLFAALLFSCSKNCNDRDILIETDQQLYDFVFYNYNDTLVYLDSISGAIYTYVTEGIVKTESSDTECRCEYSTGCDRYLYSNISLTYNLLGHTNNYIKFSTYPYGSHFDISIVFQTNTDTISMYRRYNWNSSENQISNSSAISNFLPIVDANLSFVGFTHDSLPVRYHTSDGYGQNKCLQIRYHKPSKIELISTLGCVHGMTLLILQ